jgi:hypothetical protein
MRPVVSCGVSSQSKEWCGGDGTFVYLLCRTTIIVIVMFYIYLLYYAYNAPPMIYTRVTTRGGASFRWRIIRRVLGVSSDEYLNYATENRREWEAKGLEIVKLMVEKCKSMDLPIVPAEVGNFNIAVGSKVRVHLPRVPINTPLHKDFRAKQA